MSDNDVLNLVDECKTVPSIAKKLGWKKAQVRASMKRLEVAGEVYRFARATGMVPAIYRRLKDGKA